MASEAKGRGFDPRQPHHMFLGFQGSRCSSAILAPSDNFIVDTAVKIPLSEPLTSLPMKRDILVATVICLAWRIASYAWLNLAEDSALLAMMFS